MFPCVLAIPLTTLPSPVFPLASLFPVSILAKTSLLTLNSLVPEISAVLVTVETEVFVEEKPVAKFLVATSNISFIAINATPFPLAVLFTDKSVSASPDSVKPDPVLLLLLFSPVSAETSAELSISVLFVSLTVVSALKVVIAVLSDSAPVVSFSDIKLPAHHAVD